MPPRAVSTLASMLDSDGSDVDMADMRDENTAPPERSAPARKPRKTKPASKRLSGGRKKAASKTTQRAPLKDRSNAQKHATDTEDVDEFAEEQPEPNAVLDHDNHDDEDAVQDKPVPKKRGRPAKKAAEKKATSKDPIQDEDERDDCTPKNPKNRPPGARVTSAAGKRGAKTKTQAEPLPEPAVEEEEVIADSQHTPMDVDNSRIEEEQMPPSAYRQSNEARVVSRQPQLLSRPGHRRAGSASDTERDGDPTLRRKLSDMTKKFETLQTRYTRLHDVGIREAESNFEKLRQQSQAQEKAANELIASLKAELAAARKDAGQNTSLTAQINKAKDLAKASEEKLKASETQLNALTEKLSLSQSENKSLQAKLAATRQASHDVNNVSRVPGSAVKGKNAVADRAAAAQAALAQLKEDLYSDLTGLIVRKVDQEDDQDVFDCLQTGRNGTLHFRLLVDTTDAALSYEETEFQYTPVLEENRDRDLLEILPDYLTEEITFSRANAAKFYSRICDMLTRKID